MSRTEHHRPQYPDLFGQFKSSYHLELVSDSVRTEAIFQALDRCLYTDAIFCEVGCGTGIFSIYAAQRCQKVFAVEIDPAIAAMAAENIRRSPYANRIELIQGDALTVDLPSHAQANVLLCEMMSIWAIEEPQVPVANRAIRDFLKPGGLILPQRITNLVELGHFDYEFGDTTIRAILPQFTGVRSPAMMTERRVARVLDFSCTVDLDLSASLEMNALATGKINCARLSSIVQMGPGVVFSGTDTLMPPTIVPLREEITVEAGIPLRFHASTRAGSDMSHATFAIERAEPL